MSDAIGELSKIDITAALLAETKIAFTVTAVCKKCIGRGKEAAESLIRAWKAIPTQQKQQPLSAKPTSSTMPSLPQHTLKRNIGLVCHCECGKLPDRFVIEDEVSKSGNKVRDSVRTLLAKALLGSKADVAAVDAARASERIECELTRTFPDVEAYKNKARSLAANMSSNHALRLKIVQGGVPPEDVVQYSSDQLASAEYLASLDKKKSEDLHFTYIAQGTVCRLI